MHTENQKSSYNFRLDFDLSNGPHVHRAYLVTVPFDLILAVFDVFYPSCTDLTKHSSSLKPSVFQIFQSKIFFKQYLLTYFFEMQ